MPSTNANAPSLHENASQRAAATSRPYSLEAQPDPIPCYNPATGTCLGHVPVDSPEDLRRIVAQARAASKSWAESTISDRQRLLHTLRDHLLEQADFLCDIITKDSGKTLENAMLGEIWPICEKIRDTVQHGPSHLAPEHVSPGLLVQKRARIEYAPLGVIGVICPWNYPLQNILGPTIPALFAGNAVVVKVSEWTAWSSVHFQRFIDGVLEACGLSKDLVRIVNGYGPTGSALFDAGVDKVVFTGSMKTGKKVLAASANHLTPVILELGGKDPFIVCEDANLDRAIHAAMAGTMIAAGQMCLGAERIYVAEPIAASFVQGVTDLVSGLRQGPPQPGGRVDVGATTMPSQIDIIDRLVKDAVQKGAKVRCGGQRVSPNPSEGGDFYAPTVLTDVNHSMDIMHEESFGPVMCIATFRSDEEAMEMANDTQYGLGSSVFTESKERAARYIRALRAGSTVINDFGLAYMAQSLPFGGVGGSGFGRLNGREGLRAMCNTRSIMVDRGPIQQAHRLYPVQSDDYEKAKQSIRMIYGRNAKAKAEAALVLARQAFRDVTKTREKGQR